MALIQIKCTENMKDMIIEKSNEKDLTITSYILDLIIKDLVKGSGKNE